MPQTFHGRWTVEIQLGSGKPTRIMIAGSDASDGVFDGNDLQVIGIVTGSKWSILLENLDPDLLPRKNPFSFEVPPGTLIPSAVPGP